MSAGTVVSGIITLALGLLGLSEIFGRPLLPFSLAIVGALITPFGALVLFGLITIIGLGLIVAGAVGEERPVAVEREVIVQEPRAVGAPAAVYPTLTELDLTILRYLAEGRNSRQISKLTGVSRSTVSEKMARLEAEGYITRKHTLTEKGFQAIRAPEAQRVPPPAA